MIRHDYLLKMLQDLSIAITNLLNKNKPLTEVQKDIESLYSLLNVSADYIRMADIDDLLPFLASFNDDLILRSEMLANILYADSCAFMGSNNQRIDIINKALMLYKYVETHSDDFSILRKERIDYLQQQLNN